VRIIHFYVSAISCYFHSRISWDDVLLFEEIISAPETVVGKVLSALDIPLDQLNVALEAAKLDSQVGVVNISYYYSNLSYKAHNQTSYSWYYYELNTNRKINQHFFVCRIIFGDHQGKEV